ncbi:hypothetical protein GCM10010191_58820 [Actinomadura vinacea]|uniref:DUF4190 domain-containing protein n=1 Tax=Actinomadura vinacea TaxID=115336 RepID=A0ABN3JRV0_9ACTN
MSGYGGQPPGWHDPYGQQGWDPNGQYNQAYGPGYGPPGVPNTGPGTPGATLAALICSCVATAMCCNLLAIPAIVTSAMATSRVRTNPQSTRTLTMWSWIILGIAFLIQIILIVIAVVVDATSPDYGSGGI